MSVCAQCGWLPARIDFCYLHHMKRAFATIIVILLALGMIGLFFPAFSALTR
ncbi:MAG: hypothetical protein UY97_C0003G0049 [Parcubacteria group bacterium GW2011_GWB1_57_6]|nr:MAG: hypothetical protein UY93_C0002G0173 [Parcubacteria group bacterium GW2011_GWA1_56_13]KKW46775.1 MAG: hypothetical protein UY97_C0003G0049 [Parcubacteria group bacterium GW2011_GWB1_57_6]